VVASGDFHRPENLDSWKTLVPSGGVEDELVAYLRSPGPAYLLPFRSERPAERSVAAA
jgi:hypothetical protein